MDTTHTIYKAVVKRDGRYFSSNATFHTCDMPILEYKFGEKLTPRYPMLVFASLESAAFFAQLMARDMDDEFAVLECTAGCVEPIYWTLYPDGVRFLDAFWRAILAGEEPIEVERRHGVCPAPNLRYYYTAELEPVKELASFRTYDRRR